MSTNNIVARAKELKSEGKFREVIELLKDYVEESPDDKDADALYTISVATKFFIENEINIEHLFGDCATRYQGVSSTLALQTSAFKLMYIISSNHLDESPTNVTLNTTYKVLQDEFAALGELIHPYETFKKQMDSYYSTIMSSNMSTYFYYIMSQFIDWETRLSDNVLEYIVDRVKPVAQALKISESDIYKIYTERMETDSIPKFTDKPKLSGTYPPISSEEAKNFWVGYFEFVADTREKELEYYNSVDADEDHLLNPACSAWTHVYAKLSDCKDAMTTDDYIKGFQTVTSIRIAEGIFTNDIEEARKLATSISVSPIAKIINIVKDVIEKIKQMIKK